MTRTVVGIVVAISALIVLPLYTFAGDSASPEGFGSKADPAIILAKSKQKGPPPHAPAHGYRAKHQYRYFPSVSVYLDVSRGVYFYLGGSNWQATATLPQHLRVRLGHSVNIEMDTDKPYIHHRRHKKQYPPGRMKKNTKK